MAENPWFGNMSTDGSSCQRVELENRGSLGIPAPDSEIEFGYFLFLCQQVGLDGGFHDKHIVSEHDEFTFFMLGCMLHEMPFRVLVPFDENRESDGKYMRYIYSSIGSAFSDYHVLEVPGCSVLEMLAGLTGRMKYVISRLETGMDQTDLFWIIMENIGIDKKLDNDRYLNPDRAWFILNALKTANERQYGADGIGSFFPPILSINGQENGQKTRPPKNPQNQLQLWSQMVNFITERNL